MRKKEMTSTGEKFKLVGTLEDSGHIHKTPVSSLLVLKVLFSQPPFQDIYPENTLKFIGLYFLVGFHKTTSPSTKKKQNKTEKGGFAKVFVFKVIQPELQKINCRIFLMKSHVYISEMERNKWQIIY
jgi:hypothetical protein